MVMGYGLMFFGLLLLVLAEQYWIWRRTRRPVDWLNLAANLNSGHMLMWLLRMAEVFVFGAISRHASLHCMDAWPPALQWVAGFVGWDFCFWAMHWAHHHVPALWRVHAVHHQGQEMSLSLAIRNGWLSSLTDLPFMLPLAFLGLPVEIFLAVSSVHYAMQFWNHVSPELVGRFGRLDRWMVTPSVHRGHHGLQAVYHNRNFGSILLVWDRLFGTYQAEDPALPALYGLGQQRPPNNPLVMNWPPLGERLRAAGAACLPAAYVGIGAVLLFCLVTMAIERAIPSGQWILVAPIVLGSIALGALADGGRGALAGWCASVVAAASWVVACDRSPLASALLTLLVVHAGTGAWLTYQANVRNHPR